MAIHDQKLTDRLKPPSSAHIFGTDQFGRDIYSRVISGTRDVFAVAGHGDGRSRCCWACRSGLLASYFGGLSDEVAMRLVDVLLAIPPLLLAMIILATLGPSRTNVILVVGVLYIPMVARVVRSVVLDLKTRQFVEAAKTAGREERLYYAARDLTRRAAGRWRWNPPCVFHTPSSWWPPWAFWALACSRQRPTGA